jgi:hypothetical protein
MNAVSLRQEQPNQQRPGRIGKLLGWPELSKIAQ